MAESNIEPIKYRLVGASVIVISFMLAWWLLLDHEVHRYQGEEMTIPEPLKIERFKVDKPKKPDMSDLEEKARQYKEKASTDPEPIEQANMDADRPDFPDMNASGLPEAWLIQVGSFEDKAKANALKKALLVDEFPAYVKSFTLSGSRTAYRVLVGPKLSRSRAEVMLADIKKKHDLEAIIVRYKPGFEQ